MLFVLGIDQENENYVGLVDHSGIIIIIDHHLISFDGFDHLSSEIDILLDESGDDAGMNLIQLLAKTGLHNQYNAL